MTDAASPGGPLGDLIRALAAEGADTNVIAAAVRAAQSRTARFAALVRELASMGAAPILIARAVELADQARDRRMAEMPRSVTGVTSHAHVTPIRGTGRSEHKQLSLAAWPQEPRTSAALRKRRQRDREASRDRIARHLSVTRHAGHAQVSPPTPLQENTHTGAHAREGLSELEQGAAAVIEAWNAHAARGTLLAQPPEQLQGRAIANLLDAVRQRGIEGCLALVERAAQSPLVTGRTAGGFRWSFTMLWRPQQLSELAIGALDAVSQREMRLLADTTKGRATPPPAAPPARSDPPGEDPRITRLRDQCEVQMERATVASWIDPLRFELEGGELVAIAPTDFHARWVQNNLAGVPPALRRARWRVAPQAAAA